MTWLDTFEYRKNIKDYDNRYELSFVHNLPLYFAFPIAMPWIGTGYGVGCPRILVIGSGNELNDKINDVLSSVKDRDFLPVRYMNSIEYEEFDSLDTAKRVSGGKVPYIGSWTGKLAYMQYIESSYPIDMNKVNEILSPDTVILIGKKTVDYPFKNKVLECKELSNSDFDDIIANLIQRESSSNGSLDGNA